MPAPLRILALGDPYTIGEGVAPEERWVAQITAALRDLGVRVAEPEIIARTRWTTRDLAEAIAAAAPRGPYDLVTLAAGVNDQYRGEQVGAFRVRFAALL